MLRATLYVLFASLFAVTRLPAQQIGDVLPSSEEHEPGANLIPVGGDSLTSNSSFVVRNIVITGNRKTKPQIIRRELSFREGDQYLLQDLVKKFEASRRQLMNTTLFHEVVVALKSFEGYSVDILVDVKERWYLFPMPYLKPVDNFSKWTNEYGMSLDMLDYGFKLIYKNPTGRNDNLDVRLITGYTRQLALNYDRLYFDNKMKWGMVFKFEIGRNHQVRYNTVNNKQVFYKDNNNFLRSFLKTNVELTYRPRIKTRHRFGLGFTSETIKDTIVILNPSYFNSAQNSIRFPELYYNMSYFDVDYNPYPLTGYVADFTLNKRGFNRMMNMWDLTAKGFAGWPVTAKTSFNLKGGAKIKLPFKQPYYNKSFMGKDLVMQGFETYSVDGVAGGYVKAGLHHKLINFNIHLPSQKLSSIGVVPFRIFAKVYGNMGYVHDPDPGFNFLANKMLYSGGVGIDILTLYDLTFKVEWSINQLGQKGLYLHTKSYF